ncbi:MAG: cell filamentation protein fic [Actinobacteria bacterium]|nr:cell filamentation protein fic [Actinomycetota bacterium]
MKKGRRYEETGFIEGQHEPGSRRRVLRNLLGIKKKREIERVELREQVRATEELIDTYSPDHRFTSDDIRRIHRIWFAPVYAWAGEYRKVNMTKGGFTFAAAGQIPRLMEIHSMPGEKHRGDCPRPRRRAYGVGPYPSVPGRERTGSPNAGNAHGVAGRASGTGFLRNQGTKAEGFFRGCSGRGRARLPPYGEDLYRRDPEDFS